MASEVTKEVLKAGDSSKPVGRGATITVNCTGALDTNPPKKFWSTSDPGQKPFTFRAGLGEVIKGWDDGCMTMCLGERARLHIPSHLGYGASGFPAWGIPQNANLLFDIEIVSCS